jgi:hypothetical protein
VPIAAGGAGLLLCACVGTGIRLINHRQPDSLPTTRLIITSYLWRIHKLALSFAAGIETAVTFGGFESAIAASSV